GPTPMTGLTSLTVRGASVQGASVLVPGTIVPVTVTEELQHKPEITGSFTTGPGQTFVVNPRRPTYLNLMLVPTTQFGTAQDVGLRRPTGPDDASLLFEHVLPGRYYVQAQASTGYVSSMVSGNTNLLREPLVVAAGTSPEPIDVTVRDDGGEVHGTLAGASENVTSSGAKGWFSKQTLATQSTLSKSRAR